MGYSNVTGDLNVQSTITSQNLYVYGSTNLNTLTTADGVTVNGALSVPGNASIGKLTTANLTVTGNFTVTTTNTAFSNALSVNNSGTATALKVVQFESGGAGHTYNVAEFWDYQTMAMVIDPEGNVGIHTTNTGLFGLSVADGANVDSLQALTVSTGSLSTPLANVTTLNVGTLANINLLNVYSEFNTVLERVDQSYVGQSNEVSANILTANITSANVTTENVASINVSTGANVTYLTVSTQSNSVSSNIVTLNVASANIVTGNVSSLNVWTGANVTYLTVSTQSNSVASNIVSANVGIGNVSTFGSLNGNVTTLNVVSGNVVTGNVSTLGSLNANVATLNVITSNTVTGNVSTLGSLNANVATLNVITSNTVTGNISTLGVLSQNVSTLNVITSNTVTGNVSILSVLTANISTLNVVTEIATNNVYASNAVQTPTVLSNTLGVVSSANVYFSNASGNANIFFFNQYSNVGIGTTNPTSKLHVNGPAYIGNLLVREFDFTVAPTTGSFTNVCSIVDSPNGSGIYAIRADMMTRGAGGTAMTRTYIITCNYNATTGNWTRVVPISRPSGNNQIGLDAMTAGGTTTLRATNLNANETVSVGIVVQISSTSFSTVVVTDKTGDTGTGATSSGYYPTTVLTEVAGLVGVYTETPTANLHITGNIYVSNALQGNVITANIIATNSNVTNTANIFIGNVSTLGSLNANVSTLNVISGNVVTGNVSTLGSLNANVSTLNVISGNVVTGNVSTLGVLTFNVTSSNLLNANVTTLNTFSANILTGNVSTLGVLTLNVTSANVLTDNVTTLNVFTSNTLTGNVSTLGVLVQNVSTLNVISGNVVTGNVSTLGVLTFNVTSANILTDNVTTLNAFSANIITGNVSTLGVLVQNVSTLNVVSGNVVTGNVSTLTVLTLNVTSANLLNANVTTFNVSQSNVLTGNISTLGVLTQNVSTLNVISGNVITGNVSTLGSLTANIDSLNVGSCANITNMTITTLMNVVSANIGDLSLTSANVSTLNTITSNSQTVIATTGFYGPIAGSNTINASVITASSNVNAPVMNVTTMNVTSIYPVSSFIGINKISPGYTLDISGDINYTGTLYQNGSIVGSQWNSLGTSLYYISNVGIGTSLVYSNLSVTGNIYVSNALQTTNVLASVVNAATINTTSIYGTSSGYVGINKITPGFTLDVGGNINFSGLLYQGGNLYISTQWTTGTGNIYYISNVGIGTSAVSSNLSVSGNVYASNAIQTNNIVASGSIYGVLAGSNTISASMVSATTLYGVLAGSNTISASTVSATTLYGTLAGSNTIAASTVTATNLVGTTLYGTLAGSNTIAASTFYGTIAGSNTISASTVTATNLIGTTLYGTLAGSNTIAASTVTATTLYGTIAGSNTIAASTVTATNLIGTYYGQINGSNTISASSLTLSTALAISSGGTGQTTASAGFNALSPMTTLGDTIYGGASGAAARLAGSTSATQAFLSQTGNGTVSGAPSWVTSLPLNQFSGVVAGGVAYGSATTTIATNSAGTSGQALLSGGAGAPTWGTLGISYGGTGQTTAAAGFNALSPMTTAGDIIYGGTSGAGTRLAAGTTTQVLHGGTTPSWSAVSLTADVSGTLPVANGGTGVTTSTGSGNNVLSAGPTFTGTITCAAITSSGGTIQTSYAQGTNAPNTGQAYFYNPTNSANQDASCGVRLAGSTARNCYYSYDVSGVAGFSHGITGASQNLVFKASWDMSTGTIFTMDRSGNFTASASIAANSDRRLKSNIEPITDALEKVDKISGYTFTRNDIENNPRQAGVIAQEIIEVLPEVVNKDDNGMYTVAYGNITALLIQALKEEKKKREALEKRILKLENNVDNQ